MNKSNSHQIDNLLTNCKVILINTTHPGNVGSTARAMKTMGVTELCLVSSDPNIINDHAIARASNAADILYNATIVNNLQDALEDCYYVIGTSARKRTVSRDILEPRDAANRLINQFVAEQKKIAILFGQERIGLTNEELDFCHAQVMIPTSEEYKSLNLASAVQLICYELRLAVSDYLLANSKDQQFETESNHKLQAQDQHQLVTATQMELFYEHLKELLIKVEFIDAKQPNMLMRRLRNLFNRAQLTVREINIMRGIFSACEKLYERK